MLYIIIVINFHYDIRTYYHRRTLRRQVHWTIGVVIHQGVDPSWGTVGQVWQARWKLGCCDWRH